MQNRYVLNVLTDGQRSALATLISQMETGEKGTTEIYYRGEAAFGLVTGAHRALVTLRNFEGKSRPDIAAILKAEMNHRETVAVEPAPVSAVASLVLPGITTTQRANLEQLITALKNEQAGSSIIREMGADFYGLVEDAAERTRAMRTNAPYLTRKQLGYLLSEQLGNVVVAQPSTKRPSSFTFRTMTKTRLTNIRRVIRDLKANIVSVAEMNEIALNRLDYGLTNLAVNTAERMVGRGKSQPEIAAWLDAKLAVAVREQEAAAHRAGKGKRRVQFA